jgi:hypothetical protein
MVLVMMLKMAVATVVMVIRMSRYHDDSAAANIVGGRDSGNG